MQPQEAAIMYNLGLAYFQLNKKGYAVGYWRKALAMTPSFPGAGEALEKIQEKFRGATWLGCGVCDLRTEFPVDPGWPC